MAALGELRAAGRKEHADELAAIFAQGDTGTAADSVRRAELAELGYMTAGAPPPQPQCAKAPGLHVRTMPPSARAAAEVSALGLLRAKN